MSEIQDRADEIANSVGKMTSGTFHGNNGNKVEFIGIGGEFAIATTDREGMITYVSLPPSDVDAIIAVLLRYKERQRDSRRP